LIRCPLSDENFRCKQICLDFRNEFLNSFVVFNIFFHALFLVNLSVSTETGRDLPVGCFNENSCLDIAVAENLVGSTFSALNHLSGNFCKLDSCWLELCLDLLKYV